MKATDPVDPTSIVAKVAGQLDGLGVPYCVGGSLASSAYGIPRATHDADVVAFLRLEHAAPLAASLADAFYVDADAIRDAVTRRGTFNVIELESMFKVDVFVPPDEPWFREEMARRRQLTICSPSGEVSLQMASPEDIVLHKLVWYRLGGEQSDRQWADVLGVLQVQGPSLDDAYLDRWAAALGVEDLLLRARAG